MLVSGPGERWAIDITGPEFLPTITRLQEYMMVNYKVTSNGEVGNGQEGALLALTWIQV